jgi:uncharacterized YigZ family protein
MTHYKTIDQPATAEYKDRGSKFLTYAFPVQSTDDFKKHLKQIKEKHPKAVHHCFAYRIGNDGTVYRSSDDGEPSGTAGKQILGQIDSKGLTNLAIVVVRYFGGTLLGVPGLINAYKTSASLVLQLTPLIDKPILNFYQLEFDYTLLNDVMTIIKKYDCDVEKNEMHLFCKMEVGVPKLNEEVFLEKIKEMHSVEIKKRAT